MNNEERIYSTKNKKELMNLEATDGVENMWKSSNIAIRNRTSACICTFEEYGRVQMIYSQKKW
jgi:hypothetical protein